MYLNKTYLYRGEVVLPGNVRFKRSFPVVRSTRQGYRQKLNYNIIRNLPSGRGYPSIRVIFRGFPLIFRFCNGPYIIACFLWTPCARIMNIGALCEKWCWFQIWQSIFPQSNSWLWTFKRIVSHDTCKYNCKLQSTVPSRQFWVHYYDHVIY